VDEQIN